MKTKFLALIATAFITFLSTGTAFAQSPEITREYIARNIGGVESYEETLTADYGTLQIAEGDFIRVSFLNSEDSVLDEYDIEIDIYDLSGVNLSLDPETLYGTEYIEITVFGANNVNNGVKLPFKIYLKMEEERS